MLVTSTANNGLAMDWQMCCNGKILILLPAQGQRARWEGGGFDASGDEDGTEQLATLVCL